MLEILIISGAIVGGSFTLYKLRDMERPKWWPFRPTFSSPYKTCTISFVSSEKCTPWVDRVYHTEEEYLYDETELTKLSLNSDQNELFRLCGYTGIKITDEIGQDILEVNFKEKTE